MTRYIKTLIYHLDNSHTVSIFTENIQIQIDENFLVQKTKTPKMMSKDINNLSK